MHCNVVLHRWDDRSGSRRDNSATVPALRGSGGEGRGLGAGAAQARREAARNGGVGADRVPAKVAGTWHLPKGELTLEQKFQRVSGTLTSGATSAPIEQGRVRADQISFSANGTEYVGRVNDDVMQVDVMGSASERWTATRARP